MVVEPGIGWMELNEYLEPYGLFFPLDPGNIHYFICVMFSYVLSCACVVLHITALGRVDLYLSIVVCIF